MERWHEVTQKVGLQFGFCPTKKRVPSCKQRGEWKGQLIRGKILSPLMDDRRMVAPNE